MHDDPIRLRQPGADELRAFVAPTGAAFGEPFTDAEFEQARHLWELDRLIGAIDGETWVGTGGAFSFRLTIPGGEVPAAGITMIGVSPSHRRRGILRSMLRWLLDQARERGEPVSVLWASETAIYQRFGYGIGTLQGSFDVERGRIKFLKPAEPIGRMRLIDLDEAMRLIPPVYDADRVKMVGAVSRNETKWRYDKLDDVATHQASRGTKYRAILEVDGAVRGYALYRIKSEWDEQGPNNTLLVLEVVALDAAAERAIWAWLTSIDLVGHIKGSWGPVRHPLLLQVTEPRRLRMGIRDGLLVRLLDVPAALQARTYAWTGALTFDLTDEFCPWNAGRWRLNVPSDRGEVSVTPFDGDPDLTLDVADLATVYLGGFTFADLARAGRVRECRPGAITAADGLFATVGAPWCSTMF